MLQDVQNTLKQLGLKEADAQTYFTLLSNRQGLFVSELAKETHIKRGTINLILARLHEKGFVTYHIDGARKRFTAESLEALLFRFENTLGDLRSLIPLLNAACGKDAKTKIKFFEGKNGVEMVLNDILLTLKITRGAKREYLAISSGKDIFEFQPEHQKRFIDKRVKARIPARWIAPENAVSHALNKRSKLELRQMRFFNAKKYQFNIEFDIYADKMAILSFGAHSSGVIIENTELAQSFRSLFNLLWDSLH